MHTTLRRLLGTTLTAVALACTSASAQQNVNFWYHVDNAENTKLMDELVKTFEGKNPTIKIKAENVPWNSYFDKLFISIAGGQAPDVAVTRLALQPQLLEMGGGGLVKIQHLHGSVERQMLVEKPIRIDLLDHFLRR